MSSRNMTQASTTLRPHEPVPPGTKRKFQLVTAVWGEWYVDVFLRFNIPSLLAPGNIPKLCALQQGRYVIFTRRSHAKRIASSDAYARLSRCLPVEVEALPDRVFAGNPHVIHVELWGRAAKAAVERGEWIALIAADTITADDALIHLADQFVAGKSVVYGLPLRVTEHTFMADIERFGDHSDGAWVIPPRALMRRAFENLSPLYACYLRDGRRFGDHPELILYPVPGEGLVLRIFVHHGLALDPARLELTDMLAPRGTVKASEVGFVADSDRFASVSLTPISHQADWFRERRPFSFLEAARLWNRINNAGGPYLSRQSFVFHDRDMTPAKWRPAIGRADNTVMLTFLTMKFLWVFEVALRAGMSLAADAMIWALLELKLHKSCASREKVTILVPTNDAFAKLGQGALERVLGQSRVALATMLRNHCLRGDLATAKHGQKFVTLAGQQLEVFVSPGPLRVAEYSAREIAVDDINGGHVRVYAYDGFVGEVPCCAG
jgi:Fasciclin domain